MLKVAIRKFIKEDIPLKVKWINDYNVNKYLHYDLPLVEEKTYKWFKSVSLLTNRLDYTILVIENDKVIPVGVIGILDKDSVNKKAEFYIALGEECYRGKGIAKKSTIEFLSICFREEGLNKIYLYTEVENKSARALFEKVGFKLEGILKDDLIYKGRTIDRCIYSILRKEFENEYISNTYN